MGLFSSKKKIYVSSVVYNMSGEYKDRTNYMKTSVVGAVFKSSNKVHIGPTLSNSMLYGPYNAQRSLLRWAKRKYQEGIPKAYFGDTASIDVEAVNEYLIQYYGTDMIMAESALAGSAQAYWWAYQWVLQNRPLLTADQWSYDLYSNNPATAVVKVMLFDGSVHDVPMPGFDPAGYYAYIKYSPLEKTLVPKPDPEPNPDPDPDPPEEPVDPEEPEEDEYYTNVLPPLIHIYRFGSGNPIMEGIRPPQQNLGGEFMPFMPLRIDNQFIDHPWYKDKYYDKCAKFYKKASGGQKITKLIETVADNEKLGDIDYAFVQYGVSLNTKTHACKRYLFEFFRTLIDRQKVDTATWNAWLAKNNTALAAYREMQSLYREINGRDQGNGGDRGGRSMRMMADSPILMREGGGGNDGGGDTPAYKFDQALRNWRNINPGNIPYNSISQVSDWLPTEYQLSHHWVACQQTLLVGSNNPGRKVGEIWLTNLPRLVVPQPEIRYMRAGGGDSWIEFEHGEEWVPEFYITRQVSATVAQRIKVTGLAEQNVVYKGKDIWVDSNTALNDQEESDLIIPMHMPTFQKLSLKDKNQCAVENMYILFNCYEVVKIRWYQRGIFKLFFAIVIAVISVFLPPLGGAIGIFGSSLSVGMAMGFSGITAAIMGAVTNAIAAMLLTTLIQKVTSTLFDGLLGSIIGSLVGMFMMTGFTSVFQGGGITINWGDLMKIDNLLSLTDAASQGYAAYVQKSIASMQQSTTEFVDWASEEMRKIEQMFTDILKVGNTYINPLMFTNSANTYVESGDSFISRTLMSGSEIAAMSQDMLTNFADLNLTLPDAYG